MDKENFFKELTELSRKYKIYITSCGCCPPVEAGFTEEDFTKEYKSIPNHIDGFWWE